MPGFLLHLGATVQCAHPPGQAQPLSVEKDVLVMMQPVVTIKSQYAIAGCALTGTPNPPCATALWTKPSTKVSVKLAPVLLVDSIATCAPTGTPLAVMKTQQKVIAM